MKTTLLFFASLFLIVSCSDLKRKNQLSAIDKMDKSVDSIAEVLKVNHVDTIRKMGLSMQNVEMRFKTYYIPDTVDAVFANDVNDFKQARKAIGHFQTDYNDLTKGCLEMKESLRQLRYDIENGDGDRKKYEEYLQHEQSKLNSMQRLSKDYIDQQTNALEVYNRLFIKMYDFSMVQMKKNKNKKGI